MDPPPGYVPLRGVGVTCHLLIDEAGCTLIDTGLAGTCELLQHALRRHGRGPRDVKAILLTHGHLDHAGRLAGIAELTGAPVYAHPAEQAHLDGVYPYRSWARGCALLEGCGRPMFLYRPWKIDVPIADGDTLPLWGGLRVVHLPGHTEGHCGFYSERNDLLFCGDLCFFGRWRSGLPPRFLNSCPQHLPASMRRMRQLDPGRIIANHYSAKWSPVQMREKFDRLASRYAGQPAGAT